MSYTLTTKSQVTLPKAIREHLKVAPGDAVEFRIVADGSVRVVPAGSKARGVDEPNATALAKYRSLIGMARTGTSTDEWMNLLRGYDEDATDPGFAPLATNVPRKAVNKASRKVANKAPVKLAKRAPRKVVR